MSERTKRRAKPAEPCSCGKVEIPKRMDFVFTMSDRTTHWRKRDCVRNDNPFRPRWSGDAG